MGILRTLLAVVLVVVAAIGAALFLGVLGAPSAGVEDIGDWGEVTDEQTEVVTTVRVENPNPVGIALGESVQLAYQLHLNDVALADGETGALDIQPGNSSVQISTYIQNRDLPRWWVAYVSANETIPVRADPTATIDGLVSTSVDLPTYNTTLLEDETPVITALSEVAGGAEGEYTRTLSASEAESRLGTSLLDGPLAPEEDVTVGYEIRDAWATWGEVSENRTVVRFHFRIHNPSDRVPVPAEPDNLGVDVDMNDVELFSASAEDTSLANPEEFEDDVLAPQETKVAVYTVGMDNDRIDDWFVSHVERGEQTDIRSELKLVFGVGDVTFDVPGESPIAYTCELQTGIFVDGQDTETDCGQIESLSPVEGADGTQGSGDGDDSSEDGTDSSGDDTGSTDGDDGSSSDGDDPDDQTPTETESSSPPDAQASATPTSGDPPLEVTFDASDSTDPDGDIERYVWRFGDGSPPQEGASVAHTYVTAGEYTATVTVVDADENQDTATVNVSVDSQVG